MKKLLVILFLIPSLVFGQVVNYYNFKDGSGTTLTDLKGTANGTLEPAGSLPTWSANGYLSFTGGNGTTAGNWQRVRFATRTSFDYAYNSVFSIVVIFKSLKSDANHHFICMNTEQATATGQWNIRLNPDETMSFVMRCTGNKAKIATSTTNVCDGKWHLAVLTYNNNTCICYLDGRIVSLTTNETCTGNFYNTNTRATLGAAFHSAPTNYVSDLTGVICRFSNITTASSAGNVADFNNEYFLIGW